jgi:hypothetical protein
MAYYKKVFQLAQDKGYRFKKARTICDDGTINLSDYLWGDEQEAQNHIRLNEILEDSLIELSLIQKWLRDKHKIYFEIDARLNGESVEHRVCHSKLIASEIRRVTTFVSNTYEGALTLSIHEALKHI